MIEQLLQCLRDQQDAIIKDTLGLIGFPSVTENREANRRALFWLLEKASLQGMKTWHTPEEDCGVIEIGEGRETIGILTHVDVVGPGDLYKWTTEPFNGVFDGEWIFGRGAMDDKGPTIVMYTILRLMHELNLPLKKRIQLIVGTREESDWMDIDHFKKSNRVPDYGFTPDGAFPVHNIEKGYADVRIVFEVVKHPKYVFDIFESGDSENTIPSQAMAVITTDSGNRCLQIKGQVQSIGLRPTENHQPGERSSPTSVSCEEEQLRIQTTGVSSHSSLPENGVNAICLLAGVLEELSEKEDLLHPSFRRIISFIQLMNDCHDGSVLGFDNRCSWFNGEYVGKNVVVPTMLSQKNNRVILNLNIRHRYGVTRMDLDQQFQELSREYGFSFRILHYQDPLYVPRHQPYFEQMHQAYEAVTGQKSIFALAGGTSYAKAFPRMVSWGPVFPGAKDTCHQENERIHIGSLMKAGEIYARYLFSDAVLSKKI